jgi:phenylpyruvate tautomerase PptA (4-oxalocrotonate tautomerase family)
MEFNARAREIDRAECVDILYPMPWVHIVTARKLSAEQQETLQTAVSGILEDLAGKKKQGVYISIARPEAFFWGGENRDDAAVFDVQWIGDFGLEMKKEGTRRICMEAATAVGLDPDRVRVLFTEKTSGDWGRNRGDYS